jgi:hypothetical protein
MSMFRRSATAAWIALFGTVLVGGCSVGSASPSRPPATPSSSSPVATPSPATAGPSATATNGPARPSLSPGALWIPGTHVALVPPDDFAKATAWTGFAHAESGASILVGELPAGFDEAAPPAGHPGYAQQGITVESREELTIDGFKALLIEGRQDAGGATVGKVILVIGSDELSAFLNGNYPIDDDDLGGQIRESFLGVLFAPNAGAAPADDMSFSVTPAPPLRLASTLMGSAVYNTSGQLPSADKLEMGLIIAPSFDTPIPGDPEAFARARHSTMPGYDDIDVTDVAEITVGGSDAIELVGTAKAQADGTPMVLYTVLVDEGERYVLASGWCREAIRTECLATLRDTMATYEPIR